MNVHSFFNKTLIIPAKERNTINGYLYQEKVLERTLTKTPYTF
jgi:hypothetical protein